MQNPTKKGQKLGYVRVSTEDQTTARQLDGLIETLDRVFEDKISGKNTERPQLQELLRYARDGDTIYVHSLDRFARNLDDLRKLVRDLTGRGVTVQFMKESLSFAPGNTNPMSQLLLSVMGAFAEFERTLILERQREGIRIAKRNGVYKGRKPLPQTTVDEIRKRLAAGESKSLVARSLGISRQSIYVHLKKPAV